MNYQIHITKIAERDLNRAVDHIEFALKNPQAADRLLDDTEREIMSLATMPERYALVDDPLLAAWYSICANQKLSGILYGFKRDADCPYHSFPLWKE